MKLTYRPEIDGLRAIAVAAVILYHAQLLIFDHQPFKGGFIGVDIFFVISGYLITSIILKELFVNGYFSFKRFYERRIRRIIPALSIVMLVSIPFSWMYLLPNSLIDFSKSILYSLGFSSNFYFWYSDQLYGAENGLFKPFLHTWSLSVEEQYYILFPIVLLVTFKYFKKFLIHILILGFVLSLGLADWGSKNHPSFNFYVLPTRGWELLAGSILAYFEILFGNRSKNKILNGVLPSIGILLIGHSIICFNDEMFHPSFYTFSPVFGACLIIWFSNKDEIITKILSTKLFVGVGLISYSLYLWHYPIFAFARISEFAQGDIIKKLFLGLITIFLSIITYFLIEKPFRNKNFKFKNISKILFFIVLVILITNFYIIYKNGKLGLHYSTYKNIYFNNNIYNEELRNESWQYLQDLNLQEFKSKEKIKILIVGDSHAKDLFNAFIQNQDLFKKYEFLRYGEDKGNNNPINFTNKTTEKNLTQFGDSQIFKQSDVILVSNYYNEKEGIEILDKFINKFKKKKRIILTTNSNIYFEPPNRFGLKLSLFDNFFLKSNKNKIFLDKNLTPDDKYKIDNYYYKNRNLDEINQINNQLQLIAKKHDIQILHKEDFQCNFSKKICYGVTDEGMKIHFDKGHFSLEGAKFFGKKIYESNWLKIN